MHSSDKYTTDASQALLDAFYSLVRERRKTNDTLVIDKDGKPAEVPAWDIPLPEDEGE